MVLEECKGLPVAKSARYYEGLCAEGRFALFADVDVAAGADGVYGCCRSGNSEAYESRPRTDVDALAARKQVAQDSPDDLCRHDGHAPPRRDCAGGREPGFIRAPKPRH